MVRTIDCHYMGAPGVAASYLIREGDRAAFVETNTARAVPLLLAALSDEGMRPEQVQYVIITHVHLDHAGGASALLEACPNATLLAHPRAAPHAIDPTKLVRAATAVYGVERFEALYGAVGCIPAHRVRVMADGESVELGTRRLTFLEARGHANHHHVVHDTGTDGVFTGDAFGIVYPLLQRDGPLAFPSTTPSDFDAEAALAAVDRIVATGCSRVFPTHFGEHTAVAALADQLRSQLRDYGAAMDALDVSGRAGLDLDAACAAAVGRCFQSLLAPLSWRGAPEVQAALAIDLELNGQGLASAIRKRRYKRGRA